MSSPSLSPTPAVLPALDRVHPLDALPAEALLALAAHLAVAPLAHGARLRAAWGGGDGLAFSLDAPVEWVSAAPGRARAPARTAGPGRAFLVRHLDEEGTHPRIVRAAGDGSVAWIPLDALQAVAAEHPAVAALLERLTRRDALACMHTVLGTLDDALLDDLETAADWVPLRRRQVLFHQGTRSDGLYFVVAGRLKAVQESPEGERVLGSIGPGEPAGEVAFFTGGQRLARVQAARASLVVQLTDAEFDALAARRPQLVRSVARSVVERVQTVPRSALATATVVLVPAGEQLDRALAAELAEALRPFGPMLHLDRAAADARLGGIAMAPEGTPEGERADAWLEAAEGAHRFLLLEADPAPTEWTLRCLRQADRVVVIADAQAGPAAGPVEALLDPARGATEARSLLVLLHRPDTTLPSGTRRWLEARPWAVEHHHVRRGEPAHVGRVARSLADRTVSVVLGGGGARGLAHIGILRAMMEAQLPVDQIGGTSMGAFLASHFAMGWDWERVAEVNRHVYFRLMPHRDFTIPIIALVGTRRPEASGVWVYGDTQIEDLWIPFFCVSADLTSADMRVHRRGLLRRATLASGSLPAFATPVLDGGHLLVDGGLVNNLPVDVAREHGAAVVFASEVTVEDDASFNCEHVPTPWEVLRGRFTGRRARFPSMMEVAMRSALLHSTRRQQSALADSDFAFRPPIERYGMMEFTAFDGIIQTGYEHAVEVLAGWREQGLLEAVAPRP